MPAWQYDESSRRYRSTETGRYVSAASERAIRDDYATRKGQQIADMAGKVAAGDMTVAAWERRMQRTIRELHANEFAFGRGGRQQVTDAEWARLAGVATEQERYLAEFAAAIARGELTPAQVAARAAMYGDAARSSYERGRAATYDGLSLPGYPGDGETPCLTNCLCSWAIDDDEAEWRATWELDGGEHCAGCVARSELWNPYVQARAVGVAA